MLANEGHCIDPGTVVVVVANESDVLDSICHRSRTRGVLLARDLTLPASTGALVASGVIDIEVTAKQLAIVQD